MNKSIKEERIKENLKLFSFPRLSGTEYEKRAFELAKQKTLDLNLTPEVQNFEFSTFYSRVYPKIVFPLVFWLLFTLFLNINLLFTLVNLLVVISVFLPAFIITRKPEKIRFGKVLKSQNLYIKLPANEKSHSNKAIENIIFMAHLDSKGQRITARTRGISIFLWSFSLIFLSVIIILRNALPIEVYDIFNYIGIFPLVINLLATLILSLNKTNNKSKGVIDNASGVSCVLELLNYFSAIKENIKNINLWFVFTGAEETGTMGIRNFYRVIENMKADKTLVNNFESLGKSVYMFISKNNLNSRSEYSKSVSEKAKKYGFNTYISRFSRGIHTDGIYLFRKNFKLFEFGSSEVGKFMHSEHDSLENVDTRVLKKLCEFTIETWKYLEH